MTMYEITRTLGIDCGHRVPFHNSKCRHIHGHRYELEATFACDKTIAYGYKSSSAGMVIDFTDMKVGMMEAIHDPYDHRLILWEKDPLAEFFKVLQITDNHQEAARIAWDSVVLVPIIPTAEELAKFWFGLLAEHMNNAQVEKAPGAKLVSLAVWETPNNVATYNPMYS